MFTCNVTFLKTFLCQFGFLFNYGVKTVASQLYFAALSIVYDVIVKRQRWVVISQLSCRLWGPKSVRSGNGLPLLALRHLVSLPVSTPLRIVNRCWSCSCKWRYINVDLLTFNWVSCQYWCMKWWSVCWCKGLSRSLKTCRSMWNLWHQAVDLGHRIWLYLWTEHWEKSLVYWTNR